MTTSLPACDNFPSPLSVGDAQAVIWVTTIAVILVGAIFASSSMTSGTRDPGRRIDEFLAARGDVVGWKSLGFSFLSACLGQWVLCFTPYIGYSMGWFGIMALVLSWILSIYVISYLSPSMKRQMLTQNEPLYAVTDWIKVRYSAAFQKYVFCVILCIMVLFIGTELATLALIYNECVQHGDRNDSLPIFVITGVTISVAIYCALFGFTSTLYNQMIQSILVLLLTLPIAVIIFAADDHITTRFLAVKSADTTTIANFHAAFTTMTMSFFANSLNLVVWQKTFSSEDRSVIKKSVAVGCASISIFFLILGSIGLFSIGDCTLSGAQKYRIIFMKVSQHGKYVMIALLSVLTVLVGSSVGSTYFAIISMVSSKLVSWNMKENDGHEVIVSGSPESPYASRDTSIARCPAIFTQDSTPQHSQTEMTATKQTRLTLRERIVHLLRRFCLRPHMWLNAILIFLSALVITISILVYQSQLVGNIANMFYLFNLLFTTLVMPTLSGLFFPITNAGAVCGSVSGLVAVFMWGLLEYGSITAGIEMLSLMVFSTDTLRLALERRFAVMDRSASPLLLNKTVLDNVILNATLPPHNTFSAFQERATPVFFDDEHYRAFVTTFSNEIRASYIDDPTSTWGTSIDIAFRPRTLGVYLMVPCVTFLVALLVSKLDSKSNKERALKFFDDALLHTTPAPDDEEVAIVETT